MINGTRIVAPLNIGSASCVIGLSRRDYPGSDETRLKELGLPFNELSSTSQAEIRVNLLLQLRVYKWRRLKRRRHSESRKVQFLSLKNGRRFENLAVHISDEQSSYRYGEDE